ncbi:hypothetical protein FACS189423_09840 [Bacteroidia bacterium]|nr:hypothetical protein FACS189423_09840 [Bacteroidia bacterium]
MQISSNSLKSIAPIQVDDLIRIGRKRDGGYILSQRQFDKTKAILSFGISTDWSFESSFGKQKKEDIAIYAYDYSVSPTSYLRNIGNVFLHPSILNLKTAIKSIPCIFTFNPFFNAQKKRFFFKKYVGTTDNEQYISVPQIFKENLSDQENLSILVKMDVEGAEWEILPAFKPYYSLINGFAIEFHYRAVDSPLFKKTIADLSSDFYIAHVHANNGGGYLPNTSMPALLEITFINKKLVPEIPKLSTRTYPIKGLDFPCLPRKAEIPLVFQ